MSKCRGPYWGPKWGHLVTLQSIPWGCPRLSAALVLASGVSSDCQISCQLICQTTCSTRWPSDRRCRQWVFWSRWREPHTRRWEGRREWGTQPGTANGFSGGHTLHHHVNVLHWNVVLTKFLVPTQEEGSQNTKKHKKIGTSFDDLLLNMLQTYLIEKHV